MNWCRMSCSSSLCHTSSYPHTLTDRHAVKDRIDPFGNVLLARWTSNCAAGARPYDPRLTLNVPGAIRREAARRDTDQAAKHIVAPEGRLEDFIGQSSSVSP